jgi:hypothetical protein
VITRQPPLQFQQSAGHRPAALKKRQRAVPDHINELAWKAQHRLHRRYVALSARGKPHSKVVTAVGRELLGFIWAVAVRVEQDHIKAKAKEAVAA